MTFREVPQGKFDNTAGDSSSRLYAASEKALKVDKLVGKPTDIASTNTPLEQPFHPLLATTNFADFKDTFNGILNRFSPEVFASVEIPDALKDIVASNLKTRV